MNDAERIERIVSALFEHDQGLQCAAELNLGLPENVTEYIESLYTNFPAAEIALDLIGVPPDRDGLFDREPLRELWYYFYSVKEFDPREFIDACHALFEEWGNNS
jgi:hypothetical protein